MAGQSEGDKMNDGVEGSAREAVNGGWERSRGSLVVDTSGMWLQGTPGAGGKSRDMIG
jgi:hypothetical protein